MSYSKPYLTIPQQIALLKSRGMIITNDARAASCLQRIRYYRLSGYWYPFCQSAIVGGKRVIVDDFKANTTLPKIVDLYVFDKKLRLLVLDAIERFEIALRVQTALLLGARSPVAHRDPTQLDGVFARRADPKTGVIPHREWLRRTDEAFDRSKEEFAKHFKSKYAGSDPPIWIACELWDFGALSVLFGGLNKRDQSAIASGYGITSGDVMETWIRSINVVRNVCAHDGRLWNRPSVIQPKWPRCRMPRERGNE
jgi:abortive infection bacteriophage resistance protein